MKTDPQKAGHDMFVAWFGSGPEVSPVAEDAWDDFDEEARAIWTTLATQVRRLNGLNVLTTSELEDVFWGARARLDQNDIAVYRTGGTVVGRMIPSAQERIKRAIAAAVATP